MKKISPWAKGRILENQVEKIYIDQGYKTYKPPKTKFGSQDILGVGDIICTSPKELVLIAVATRDAQKKTLDKILKLLPFLPNFITIRYYIERNRKIGKAFEVREWKGQS